MFDRRLFSQASGKRSLRRVAAGVLVVAAFSAVTVSAASAQTKPKVNPKLDPVKLAVIGTFSDPTLGVPQVADAVKAWAVYQNDKLGGINGHRVEVTACDDKNTPAEGANCARQAVADGVVAGVGNYSFQGASIWPIFEAAGIPVVGLRALSPSDNNGKLSYPIDGATTTTYAGVAAALMDEAGCKKLHGIRNELASAKATTDAEEAAVTKKGGEWTGDTIVPLTAGDVAPMATAALQKADCIAESLNAAFQPRLVTALTQINPNVKIGAFTGGLPADWTTSLGAGAKNILAVDSFQPLSGDNPGIKKFLAAMEKQAPSAKRDVFGLRAWTGATVMAEVAKSIKGDITSASIVKALDKAKNVNTDGIIGPLDFTKPLTLPGITRLFNPYQVWERADNSGGIKLLNGGDWINVYPIVKGLTTTTTTTTVAAG